MARAKSIVIKLPLLLAALPALPALTATADPAADLNLRCGQNDAIRKRLNEASFGAEARLSELRGLGQDLETLRRELTNPASKHARNFLQNCLTKKAELIRLSSKMASDSLRDSYDWLVTMGDIAQGDGNPTDAMKLFERALTKRPGEHDLRRKLAVAWKDRVMTMIRKGEIPKADPKALENLFKQTLDVLRPVLEDADAPPALKAEFHLVKGLILDSMGRYAEAIGAYREAIAFDPKNKLALINVATWAYDRGHWAEARQAYEKLAPLDRPRESIQLRLLELQAREGDWKALLSTADEALKAVPANAKGRNDIAAYRGMGLLKTGDAKAAEKTAKEVLKQDAKQGTARRTMALWHMERGESAAKGGSPGLALVEYDQAFKYDPALTELREAMARLIFDIRRDEGLKASDAAVRTDLKRVTELLDPLVADAKRVIDSKSLLAHSESAIALQLDAAAAKSCLRYDADYGSLPSAELVMGCARALQAQGQGAKGRELLKKAIDGGRFGGAERKLLETLNRMN